MAKGVILSILAFAVFLLAGAGQASAGLIINNSQILVNKVVGTTINIPIQLTNNESFPFYNVTFESNSYIAAPKIDVLPAGSTAILNASVIGDSPGNYTIRMQGFYIMQVGQNPSTHYVNITQYNVVPDPCDLSIIKGDSVQWGVGSGLLQNIEIRQSPYQSGVNTIALLTGGQSFSRQFTTASQFTYRFYVTEFSPGECVITVLDDSGPVNNPKLDGILKLQINTTYDPTSLSISVLTKNYTLDFFGKQDGIMSVTNTGNKPAYNVKLAGDWLSFSSNGFNLAAGETKGIIFTLQPVITQTNQTNQTYAKQITATGNFPAVTADLSIFINFANIATNLSSQADLEYFKNTFCVQFPNSIFCNPDPKVVYKYINNASDLEVNVSVTQAKLDSIWLYLFTLGDDFKTLQNFVKEMDQNMTENIADMTQNVRNLTLTTSQNSADAEKSRTGLLVAIILIAAFISLAIVGALIFVYKKNAAMHNLRRMGLGK